MTVNTDSLSKVISKMHSCEPMTLTDDGMVMFGMICGLYEAHVYLRIFDKATAEGRPNPQAISATLIFTDEKYDALDFRSHEYATLLEVCNEVQQSIDWGAVSPVREPDGCVEVGLYRTFNTSDTDLDLALKGDPRSELLSALLHLGGEFEMGAPIIQGFHNGSVKSPTHIQAILDLHGTATAM